jgi:polyphosphate kinase
MVARTATSWARPTDPRNLSNRIEVMTPVYDEDLKRDLMRTIDFG